MKWPNPYRWMVAAALAMFIVALPPSVDAAPAPALTQHCVLRVTGTLDSGELTTDPLECFATGPLAAAATASSNVIARHYTGFNFTGSELDIVGSSCSGGWLNMPAGWVNVIASTLSICTVDHYDYFYLLGDSARLYWPGGNLYWFYQRTNSAQYL